MIKQLMKQFRKFSAFDVTVFKLYMVLIGAVIGAYIADFVKQYVWVFLIIIVVSLIYIMNRMFKK